MRVLQIICILFLTLPVFAQEETTEPKKEKIPDIRMGIKSGFKLPTPVANSAFAKTIDGIADAFASYHFPVMRYFYAGGGYRYTYFQINDFKVNSSLNANLQIHSPYAVFGYERFANSRFLYGFGLKGGYSFLNFFSNSCSGVDPDSKGHGQSAWFIDPELSLSLMAGENLCFSFLFSWTIIGAEYGPENLCLPNFSGLKDSDNQGNYQFFSAGFGFTVFLGGEKKRKARYLGYYE